MIEIERMQDCFTISDPPYIYKRHEYRNLLQWLTSDFYKPEVIVSLRATGAHLAAICEHFHNIPKPNGSPDYGFVWTGEVAGMIVANIILALRNDVSVIIQTVDDYQFDWHNQ